MQVRKALSDIDPNLALIDFGSYDTTLENVFGQQGMIAELTLLFGGLALVLAAVGLYGVTAYAVEQRTSEIGIRMALGADRASVLAMVLRGASLQVVLGLLIGIPAAIAAGRAITAQLYAVNPWDPGMLAFAALLLAVAAFIAAVIPARRAAGLNPIQALRSE
jgi:ABC-type antimicrobial peptide transport system permease subunit